MFEEIGEEESLLADEDEDFEYYEEEDFAAADETNPDELREELSANILKAVNLEAERDLDIFSRTVACPC